MNMRRTLPILTAVSGWLLLTATLGAQDTNLWPPAPRTKLEALETNIGSVLIKGTTLVGSISAPKGVVMVKCKEFTDTGTGRREYGISVDLVWGGQAEESSLVDYDELGSLLTAMDYLNRVDWQVTSMAGFDAVHTTKSGLRVAAHGRKRTGTIECSVTSPRLPKAAIPLTRGDLAQLRIFVEEAKTKLDSIRK
jgi:hypothetical protein